MRPLPSRGCLTIITEAFASHSSKDLCVTADILAPICADIHSYTEVKTSYQSSKEHESFVKDSIYPFLAPIADVYSVTV